MENKINWLELEKYWVMGETECIHRVLKSNQIEIVKFTITAKTPNGNIDKLKDLLTAVHAIKDENWEYLDIAVNDLPVWFLQNSAPPMTNEQTQLWLTHWRKASRIEQLKLEEERGWEAANWLYWLHPNVRVWYLIEEVNNQTFSFANPSGDEITGAAKWMLKMCDYELSEAKL